MKRIIVLMAVISICLFSISAWSQESYDYAKESRHLFTDKKMISDASSNAYKTYAKHFNPNDNVKAAQGYLNDAKAAFQSENQNRFVHYCFMAWWQISMAMDSAQSKKKLSPNELTELANIRSMLEEKVFGWNEDTAQKIDKCALSIFQELDKQRIAKVKVQKKRSQQQRKYVNNRLYIYHNGMWLPANPVDGYMEMLNNSLSIWGLGR